MVMMTLLSDTYFIYMYLLSQLLPVLIYSVENTFITVCKEGGSFPSVEVNCGEMKMIHIQNITYLYHHRTECELLSDTPTCGQPLTGRATGLMSICSGQPTCKIILPNNANCTAGTIFYICIQRSEVTNVCKNITLPENTPRLYLSSPDYPETWSGSTTPSCQCSIRGSRLTSLTVLDLVLKTSSSGTRSFFSIHWNNTVYYSKSSRIQFGWPVLVDSYRPVSLPATAVDVLFRHGDVNGLKLWIEIEGISLTGYCYYDGRSTYVGTTDDGVPPESVTEQVTTTEITSTIPGLHGSTTPVEESKTGKYTTFSMEEVVVGTTVMVALLLIILTVFVLFWVHAKKKEGNIVNPNI